MEGLIHAFDLDGLGGVTPSPYPFERNHCAQWIHLNFDNPGAKQWLRNESQIDPIVVEALLAEESRPRFNQYDNGVLLILRGVNLNPDEDPEDMVSIRIWLEEGRIISTRRRVLLSVQDTVKRLKEGKGPRDSGELITTLCQRLTGRVADFVDRVDDQVTSIEDRVVDQPKQEHRKQVADLKRQIIALRRYLLPEQEAFDGIIESDSPLLSEHDRRVVEEINERLMRKLDQLESVSERISVIIEQLVSYTTDLLNQRMYLLSIISAVFLPLGFLTGLLGVNIGGIPGTESPWAFTYFVAGLTAISALMLWYFYRNRWM
ncbi:zinc transporter ZntB [Neptunomonas sp.]|uniref:zinc transporter ZntB n=1 Tax=Neptunomonas TaxID=75687 RepID=UPI003513F6C0